MTPAPPHDPRTVEALLAFWADAGVDACLAQAPVDRLSRPLEAASAATQARAPADARRESSAVTSLNAPERGERRLTDGAALAQAATGLEALVAAARAVFPGPCPALSVDGEGEVRLMVVGDAPSGDDEAQAAPFSGARGALVRALLAAAGLGDGVLYTYTVFHRPRGGADPAADDQARAAPFLVRAAALARPSAVMLLGACAVKGVCGVEQPILKLRGRWLDWDAPGLAAPLPAMATLGPDFLLAHPAAKKQAWGDILSLAARLDQSAAVL